MPDLYNNAEKKYQKLCSTLANKEYFRNRLQIIQHKRERIFPVKN